MPIKLLNQIDTPKKENLIVLGMSSNLIFAGACAIQDLKRFGLDSKCDILLLTDRISSRDLNVLTERFQCRVGKYISPFSGIRFYLSKGVRIFTPVVFSKYECLKLLKEYKKVIWMDYDIVMTQRVDELLFESRAGIRALMSPQSLSDCFYVPPRESFFTDHGIGTGLLVFDRKLQNFESLYDECIQLTERYVTNLYLPEQGVFNLVFGGNEIDVEWLDMDVYAVHPSKVGELTNPSTVKILHSFGTPKFWNGLDNKQWMENYNNWISYGGSTYVQKSTVLRTLSYRIYDNCMKLVSKIQTWILRIHRLKAS